MSRTDGKPPRSHSLILAYMAGDGLEDLLRKTDGTEMCVNDPDGYFIPNPSKQYAEQMCEGCHIKDDCLDYALTTPGVVGIWGGTNERGRESLKRSLYRRAVKERRRSD